MDMQQAYAIFQTVKLEEKSQSLNDQIKQLESVLDLRDYYDIKRPTVVFFSMLNNKRLTVMRYDIMCEIQQES